MVVEATIYDRTRKVVWALSLDGNVITFGPDYVVANRKFFALDFDVLVLVMDPLFKFDRLPMIYYYQR